MNVQARSWMWAGAWSLIWAGAFLAQAAAIFHLNNISFYWDAAERQWTDPNSSGLMLGDYRAFVLASAVVLALGFGAAAFGGSRLASCRWGTIFAFGAAIAASAFLLGQSRIFDLDDKWAYYRTSRLVLSEGLPRWNPGEALNVNTSWLWPYLICPGHLLGDVDAFAKIVGAALLLGTATLIWKSIGDPTLKIVGIIGVLCYYPSALWSLGGLDTALGQFYIAGAVYVSTRCRENPPSWTWLVWGSALWVRPDTILIGAGALGMYLLRASWSARLRAVACFAGPAVAFVAFNYLFFETPLPTPYYVKGLHKAFSGHYPFFEDLLTGLNHWASSLSIGIVLAGVVGVAMFAIVVGRRRGLGWDPLVTGILVGCFLHTGYFVICGYQHMGFAFRYFLPGWVAAFTVGLLQLDRNGERVPVAARSVLCRLALFVQIPVSIFACLHGTFMDVSLTDARHRDQFSVKGYADWMTSWIQAGKQLGQVVSKTDRIYAETALATAAIGGPFVYDPYYAPPQWSRFPDLRHMTGHPFEWLVLGNPLADIETDRKLAKEYSLHWQCHNVGVYRKRGSRDSASSSSIAGRIEAEFLGLSDRDFVSESIVRPDGRPDPSFRVKVVPDAGHPIKIVAIIVYSSDEKGAYAFGARWDTNQEWTRPVAVVSGGKVLNPGRKGPLSIESTDPIELEIYVDDPGGGMTRGWPRFVVWLAMESGGNLYCIVPTNRKR